VLKRKNLLKLYTQIFSRPYFYRFNKFLFDISLRGLGIYCSKSGIKYFYSELLQEIISDNEPVIFDVGANVGINTTLLNKNFPSASIYSFEPNPKCFEKLKIIEKSNIKVFDLALGDKIKKIKLYDRESTELTKHSTFYKDVIKELHSSALTEYEVNVTTLDKICEQENINKIDFLKIDTEGNDYYVLNGAKNLLSNNAISCIQFEFNTMNVMSRVFFRDFILLLQNYKLYRILPTGLLKLNSNILYTEIYGLQNIVAVLDHDNSS